MPGPGPAGGGNGRRRGAELRGATAPPRPSPPGRGLPPRLTSGQVFDVLFHQLRPRHVHAEAVLSCGVGGAHGVSAAAVGGAAAAQSPAEGPALTSVGIYRAGMRDVPLVLIGFSGL